MPPSTARRALITGVEGQDGWYVSDLLLGAGAEVVGSALDPGDVPAEHPLLHGGGALTALDVTDHQAVRTLVAELRPDVVVHLAGLSSGALAWEQPALAMTVNAGGTAALLHAVRALPDPAATHVVHASSAEIFDSTLPPPYDETTPLGPRNPYGVSKAAAHTLVQVLRGQGLRASNAVLFNHESPLRPPAFVTSRIADGVARISLGLTTSFTLGNLEARRDWIFAGDTAAALVAIAASPRAGDWVVAGGVSRSVADLAAAAFAHVGIDDWRAHVDVDTGLLRLGDAPEQRGDAARIAADLGWRPATPFATWVGAMVESAANRYRTGGGGTTT